MNIIHSKITAKHFFESICFPLTATSKTFGKTKKKRHNTCTHTTLYHIIIRTWRYCQIATDYLQHCQGTFIPISQQCQQGMCYHYPNYFYLSLSTYWWWLWVFRTHTAHKGWHRQAHTDGHTLLTLLVPPAATCETVYIPCWEAFQKIFPHLLRSSPTHMIIVQLSWGISNCSRRPGCLLLICKRFTHPLSLSGQPFKTEIKQFFFRKRIEYIPTKIMVGFYVMWVLFPF